MRMNEPAHAICEQHIHFLRFYERRYFALAKRGMHQRLSFAIRASLIVGHADLGWCTGRCASAIHDAWGTHWTTDPRDSAYLAHGNHDVAALLVTDKAQLIDAISNFENYLLFHDAVLNPLQ
jgi:hypothetical protein